MGPDLALQSAAIAEPPEAVDLYDRDFVAWCLATGEALRRGRFEELDIENLIDEVEAMAKSQVHALDSSLQVLLLLFLNRQFQPGERSSSWESAIVSQRGRIQGRLEDSPSLRGGMELRLDRSYQIARHKAALETGTPIEDFPSSCPYTVEQILDDQALPE